MDRDSSLPDSRKTREVIRELARELRSVESPLTRSLEFLVNSYVGNALLTCRRDRREFLSEFSRFRPELAPLLAAADIAMDAFETIEANSPRKRRAEWRRLPIRKSYSLRSNFIRGSRLFAEFMSEVRHLRTKARERVREGGAVAAAARQVVAWAKPILRDPVLAARVFDEGARSLVARLSKPVGVEEDSLRADRQVRRMN